ncbi:MAG: hypothetical protein RLZZ44_246 [Bacteroidota bacterium]
MKIGFFVFNQKQLSTVYTSEVIQIIGKKHELSLFLKNNINMPVDCNLTVSTIPEFPFLVQKVVKFRNFVALWRGKDTSLAYKLKAYSQFGKRSERYRWESFIVHELSNWSELKRFWVRVFSNKFLYSILTQLVVMSRKIAIKILYSRFLPKFQGFDLIVIPFSGHDSTDFFDIIWICKQFKIKTFAIQENWDNLSSKIIIVDAPDYFGVWGEQSKEHLLNLHKFPNNRIFILGSPRYEYHLDYKFNEFSLKQLNLLPSLSNRYILIAGTGEGSDDLELIGLTKKACDRFDLKLIYRPHPFARNSIQKEILSKQFPELIIDNVGPTENPRHLIGLLKNATIIISQLSTLVLEGLIFCKPVCIPVFVGKKVNYGYDKLFHNLKHYEGLDKVKAVQIARNQSEFEEILNNFSNLDSKSFLDVNVNWYCAESKFSKNFYNSLELLETQT